ncbi:MAG: histidine kinase, partial [Burkholderiaceae bacterium]|nr:histidine kinase [Burkholderiaceae bacterium]
SELLAHVNDCWDDERRALARQLHDSLGSSLTALTMHLSLLERQLPATPALLDRSGQMKQLLLKLVDQNRQMQLKLWNDKLEFLGLCAALGEVATQFGERLAIMVRRSLPEDEPVYPRRHGVALLRALEEALSNIAAHAQASEVDVILDDGEDALMLTVKDNGVGLPPQDAAPAVKHGLRALRERLHQLGGTLTVAPGESNGTTLTAILPRNPAPQ